MRNKLHNFKSSFFKRSPITRTIKGVKNPTVRDKYWFIVEKEVWNHRPRKIRGLDRRLDRRKISLETTVFRIMIRSMVVI